MFKGQFSDSPITTLNIELSVVRYHEMYKITKGAEGCVTLYAGLSLRTKS